MTQPDRCYNESGSSLDQRIHNYIIHEKIIKIFKLYVNDEASILTLGYMTPRRNENK